MLSKAVSLYFPLANGGLGILAPDGKQSYPVEADVDCGGRIVQIDGKNFSCSSALLFFLFRKYWMDEKVGTRTDLEKRVRHI